MGVGVGGQIKVHGATPPRPLPRNATRAEDRAYFLLICKVWDIQYSHSIPYNFIATQFITLWVPLYMYMYSKLRPCLFIIRVSGGMWLKTFDCSESEPCFTDCYEYPENPSWITDCSSGTVGVSCGMCAEP